MSGKAMGKYAGKYWNDVRQYHRNIDIAQDGLLIVTAEAKEMTGDIHRRHIIIPKSLVTALLYTMHNKMEQHQPKSQEKIQFQRQFYAIVTNARSYIKFLGKPH